MSSSSKKDWSPNSWRSCPIVQQPEYPDADVLESCVDKVRSLPPLISSHEVDALRSQLAEVAEGKRFLLQGGDCAERFDDCAPDQIEKKLRILLQMSLVVTWGARIPTVRVGRMAGQFAKPRSKPKEMVDGVEVCTFRGDNVNGFDPSQRTPDPNRLVEGYFHSAATLNYARSLLASGFADIHDASKWDLGFVNSSARRDEYSHLMEGVMDSLEFVNVCGIGNSSSLSTVDLFVSHEGLNLSYEEAMTRRGNSSDASATSATTTTTTTTTTSPTTSPFYNLSTHFLWIGDRTRQLDHAHVEYFRGVANPIGVKVGPSMAPAELVELIQTLWPDPAAAPGKITLISRFGADNVREKLPALVAAVQAAGLKPVWICDPCHGNTFTAPNGYKTRNFDKILSELRETFMVHREAGSFLGGVHFELTGENVTECVGGPEELSHEDLPHAYTTYCDPRLNYAQSMEVAFLLVHMMRPELMEKRKRARHGSSGSMMVVDDDDDEGGELKRGRVA